MPPFIQRIIDRYGPRRSAVIALVGVGSLALVWAFAQWATAPSWVPVHSGIPLEVISDVIARLDDARIPYRLAKGGAELQVPESDLARARVLLAQEGLTGRMRPGFELFDQPAWAMTDFTQRVNYRRALEGELARTISQMRGIESAQVHLALPESSLFRRGERRPEASVFLKLRPGFRASADLVEGIAFLVASSVDGLSGESVTVLDDSGRVLSAASEPGSTDIVTKRQLNLQREIEERLERKAEELVARVVGPGNVQVRVSASVSFDRIDRTTQSVDPDEQVVIQQQRSEIVPGPDTEGAASTVQNTTYDITRRLEVFSGGIGEIRRLTVAVLVNAAAGDRADGDAPGEPWTVEELQRIETLVRTAVGVDEGRGDVVSVVSVPFTTEPAVAVGGSGGRDLLMIAQGFARPAVAALALVLAFILGLRVVRTLPRGPSTPVEAALEPAGTGGALPSGHDEAEAADAADGPRFAVPWFDARDEIAARLRERPDNAVRVIRAWLRE